jgi:4-methylaminobutanoate oxidase (formaldehyde-forming)
MADLPGGAEAVVVGGGVIGCSVAYHLAKGGVRDVLLLERDRLGSGTTWHSAGNITWKPHDPSAGMVLYAYELLEALPGESGLETGWKQTGRLFLARGDGAMDSFRALAARAGEAGLDAPLLAPAGAAARNPLIDPDAIAGAWYNPRSGRLDPANYTAALARAAARRGARIVEGCPVAAIETRGGAVSAVETEQGRIETGAVVLCAGLWSRDLAGGLDVALAQWPTEHFYVIAEPAGGVARDMPAFICPENLIYGREEVGGFLWGCFDEDAKVLEPGDLPEGFSFSLLNEDWDKIMPYFEQVAEIFPALRDAPVRSFVNGPESFTPDGVPLAGPVAGTGGLYVASAMNSTGVTLAAGLGRMVADMVAGRPPAFDPARFAPGRFGPKARDEAWLKREVSGSPSRFYRATIL